ncbi:hypothetical protein EJB05_05093, partial [Eragrostis curvula]
MNPRVVQLPKALASKGIRATATEEPNLPHGLVHLAITEGAGARAPSREVRFRIRRADGGAGAVDRPAHERAQCRARHGDALASCVARTRARARLPCVRPAGKWRGRTSKARAAAAPGGSSDRNLDEFLQFVRAAPRKPLVLEGKVNAGPGI